MSTEESRKRPQSPEDRHCPECGSKVCPECGGKLSYQELICSACRKIQRERVTPEEREAREQQKEQQRQERRHHWQEVISQNAGRKNEATCVECGETNWTVIGGVCKNCRIAPLTPQETVEYERREAVYRAEWGLKLSETSDRLAARRVDRRIDAAEYRRQSAERRREAQRGKRPTVFMMMTISVGLNQAASALRRDHTTERARKQLREVFKTVEGVDFGGIDGESELIREEAELLLRRLRRLISGFPRTDGVPDADAKLVKWVAKIEAEIFGASITDGDELAVQTGVDWDAEMRRMDEEDEN